MQENRHRRYRTIARLASRLFKTLQIEYELVRLLQIVNAMQSLRVILEIGTQRGGTLFAFSQLADLDALLISIDLPDVTWNANCEATCGSDDGEKDLRKLQDALRSSQPKQQCHFIRKNSHDLAALSEVIEILDGRDVDFLFIDGDHSYEGVKQDFEMYYPLVAPGGVIAFHDIHKPDPSMNHNVVKFWEEIRHSFRSETIIDSPRQDWAGIGVLYN